MRVASVNLMVSTRTRAVVLAMLLAGVAGSGLAGGEQQPGLAEIARQSRAPRGDTAPNRPANEEQWIVASIVHAIQGMARSGPGGSEPALRVAVATHVWAPEAYV